MKLKHLIAFPIFLTFVSFISCGSDTTTTTDQYLSSDAQITSFKLVADTAKGINLDKAYFTINQQQGLIFNADSLPVGTKKRGILASISYATASKVEIQYAGKEYVEYKTTDSLDFSTPFHIKVTAYNGTTSKVYTVQLNVHTVDPEVMAWQQVTTTAWSSTVYTSSKTVKFNNEFVSYLATASGMLCFKSGSTDAAQWTLKSTDIPADANIESITLFNDQLFVNTISGMLYSSTNGENWVRSGAETGFVAILGNLVYGTEKRLIVIKSGAIGSYNLAASTDGATFVAAGDQLLPDDFPIKGFAAVQNVVTGTQRLTLLAGIDKNNQLLGTVQQLYWDNDGLKFGYNINNHYLWFGPRAGANAYVYDGKLVLTCGKGKVIQYKDTWMSKDYGVSWYKADSIVTQTRDTIGRYPKEFVGRSYASTVVDENSNVWVFGGVMEDAATEVWRGRINRLGFKK